MNYMLFIYCSLLVFLLTGCGGGGGFHGGSTGTSDWPLFRGDASMSGYTDIRLPKNPTLLWTYKSDARTSSSPVVANGTTYWSDKRGHIRGVDMTGVQVFSYNFQTAVDATPMIHNSVLYIGRIDGVMSAISLSQKDTLWNYETMGQLNASANYADFEGRKAVVFGSYDNYLYCLDSRTGQKINRFESGYYINGAVALWKNYVIFGGCDSWLRIIDCQTGIATDSLLLDNYIPASPAIMGDFCYVGDYSGNIYECQLEKGKIVRHQKIMEATGNDGSFISVPSITSTNLYFLSSDQHLYSINRKDGSVQWKYLMKGATGESSPVVCRDKIIVCTKTGVVSILDIHTGISEWVFDTGEQIVASPAVIKGCFFILTAKGTLFCFG
jgi:outer membrane protein assembly factor BamB